MSLLRETLSDLQCRIRLIHALPKVGPVDIYANGELVAKDLAFGKFTTYSSLNSGSYEIELYPTGLYDSPIFTKTITLLPRSISTISVITLNDGIELFTLNDSSGNQSISNSFLRFINLSPTSPLLTLTLSNNRPLFNNVEYVETTGYYPLSPGIYNLRVVISSAQAISKSISQLRLINGQFHTIYVIGLFNDTPQLGYIVLTDGR